MRPWRTAVFLLLLARPAAAQQDEPTSTVGEETDPAVIEVRDKLKSDPALADSVAARVARSRLIGQITQDQDENAKLAAAKAWIARDPAAAAHVALGLASDDSQGVTTYEDTLLKQMGTTYGANAGAQNNLFHTLSRNAKNSKLLKKQSEDMSPDEQREILRTLFEGKGAESDKVINTKPEEGGASTGKPSRPAATSFNGIYDRLGAGNLHGYSPQLLALQNALSGRRPPGAPALIETGKLDYATLSYPGYGMNYDANNLEARLRQDRILALARLAGRTLTARDWKDPDLEAKLAAQVSADKLSPRFKRRAELAAKARAAMQAFLDAAAKAKDPGGITRGLLIELGRKQKETARWLADAALEEELSRLEPFEGFPSPELLASIDAVPVVKEERDAYKRRGDALKTRLASVKANAEKAQGLLESDGWADQLAAVDALTAQNQDLKRDLGRDVDDFSRVPPNVADSLVVQPRWREWLDDLAVKWAPSLSYSRGVALRRGRLSRFLAVFGLIASGDANGAHTALVNETGGR